MSAFNTPSPPTRRTAPRTRALPAGSRALAAVLLAWLALSACSEARLEPIPPEPVYRDDKLEVSGEICTREPETLTFPLRVLFIVDSSVSMDVTDPPDPVTGETGRERSVRETWEHLLDQGPSGVRVGVIRFSAEAQGQTGVDEDTPPDGIPDTFFTADRSRLTAATASLGITDRTTNYNNALGEAYYEIRTELLAADQESLPLSKYVVVFLSDGIPDTDDTDSRGNAEDEIVQAVSSLRELADTFRVGEFAFHTAYLTGGDGISFDRQAASLLERMAKVGGGSYRSFPNGEQLNFLFVDFTVLKRVFTLKSLVAFNTNVVMDVEQLPPPPVDLDAGSDAEDADVEDEPDADLDAEDADVDPDAPDTPVVEAPGPPEPTSPLAYVDENSSTRVECGEPLVDSDSDGLSDLKELEIGTNPLLRDTDDDGINDRLEWDLMESGLDPLIAGGSCFNASPCVDVDDDGFCDCILDVDANGRCDCEDDPETPCLDDRGHDCLDANDDGRCDCPDVNADGRCDYPDRDGDGLHDCEEVLYGTAQNGADSDADGFPDAVEVHWKTNPTQRDDLGDADFDRTRNGVEVLANTDPQCDDAALRSRVAYRYRLDYDGLDGARSCYSWHVANITLVPTLPGETAGDFSYPGNGWNRIYIFAGEVAFDDPNAFASYRMACVMAAYHPDGGIKNPPSGRIRLTEADFVEVSDFDPDTHCIFP